MSLRIKICLKTSFKNVSRKIFHIIHITSNYFHSSILSSKYENFYDLIKIIKQRLLVSGWDIEIGQVGLSLPGILLKGIDLSAHCGTK